MLQVLVDADNVTGTRLQALLDILPPARLVAAGSPQAVRAARWPGGATVLPCTGWQRADLTLAAAYSPAASPLVLVSGDGDFALLAARHPGPVLVVSEAASGRLRAVATVLDPVQDGVEAVRRWLDEVLGIDSGAADG